MKRTFLTIATLAAMTVGQTVAQAQGDKFAPPIMGWSSWNTYHVNISDSLIMKQADAMVRLGLKDAGYRYINIDDGFFGHRDNDGTLVPHPTRFPNGVKPVAQYIHSLGLKAGIYSDAGANTCGSRFDNDVNGFGVGLYGHERQDARLFFRDWGFDFIKIDYCGAGYDLELDERKRYTEIANAFKEEGCGNVQLNICRWIFPGTWAADIATSWRISPDIRPRWSSVKSIVERNLYLSAYCRNGHFNDMDMLEIGRGLKLSEEEVHFGLWCMMSSPLLIGCDLEKIPQQSLALLKNPELIALNQDSLCQQAYVAMENQGGYVLVKDVKQRHALTRAIALYNPTDSALHFNVPLTAVELGGKVKLRDLIARKNMKAVRDSIVATLPAHSVKIMSAEAEQRLERKVYEAEQAYLPLFDCLGKRKQQIRYERNDSASGKMVVSHIGGEEENLIRWDNVWSNDGGRYVLTVHYVPLIHYVPVPGRQTELTVNGNTKNLTIADAEGAMSKVSILVTLNKGDNTIEITNPYAYAPNIDCIELVRVP